MRHFPPKTPLAVLISLSGSLLFTGTHSVAADNISPTLPTVAVKDKPLTYSEQAVLTSGDRTIIARDAIRQQHVTTIVDVLRRIPGVQIFSGSFRAAEYGTGNGGDTIAINGDRRVVILIDGRRIDSDATAFNYLDRGSADLNNLTNLENVERIEILRGPSTLAYGADASGGVINIITRQQSQQDSAELTTHNRVHYATGSWQKHVLDLNHSGNYRDLNWMVTLGQERSGDTHYKDASIDHIVRYYNTHFRDSHAALKVEKSLGERQSLALHYSHLRGRDHYPISAPDYIHPTPITPDYNGPWDTVFLKPGYRNEWWVDKNKHFDLLANTAHTTKQADDVDLYYSYTVDGIENFARIYRNRREYQTVWSSKSHTQHDETGYGFELQGGTVLRKQDILLVGLNYRTNEYQKQSHSNYGGTVSDTFTEQERDSTAFFIQDKIALTSAWTLTPALRYDHISDSTRDTQKNKNGKIMDQQHKKLANSSSYWTKALFSSYQITPSLQLYGGWNEVYKPVSGTDEAANAKPETPLQPDEGYRFSAGLHYQLRPATQIDVNYAYTRMDNTVVRYSVYQPKKKRWQGKTINAWQRKRAFNLALNEQLTDHWQLSASYAYAHQQQQASHKPDDFWPDALINELQPKHTLRAELRYQQPQWSTRLWLDNYRSLNRKYYTDNQFVVWGFSADYQWNKNASFYLRIDNLTNQAYETKGSSFYGPGAYPMPSRQLTAGIQAEF